MTKEMRLKDECGKAAMFGYVWPGKELAYCCVQHAAQIQNVGGHIGYRVEMIPLAPGMERMCSNKIEKENG